MTVIGSLAARCAVNGGEEVLPQAFARHCKDVPVGLAGRRF